MTTFNISSIIPEKFKTYTHTQSTAATTWTINHNLTKIPIDIKTFNTTGTQIFGYIDWEHATTTSISVIFGEELTGTAKIIA
jgi:hypothetical protein